jgi:chromosome segregation ATPase
MAGFLARASKAASAASAAVVPQPSYSLADIVAELRELRDQNSTLNDEKALLKSQVALLSQQLCLAPSERTVTAALPAVGAAPASSGDESPPPEPSNAALAPPSTGDEGRRASAFNGLRAELATNLGVDPESARASQAGALSQQLARARLQADAEANSRQVVSRCLAAELRRAEAMAETSRLEALVLLETVRTRCGELEGQLQAQAIDAQRATQAAVAAARSQAHRRAAELEEALETAQEELARKEAAMDAGFYGGGSEEELDAERRRRAEWMAKCELLQATVAKLHTEIGTLQASHEPELRSARLRAEAAEASLASLESRLLSAEATRAQAERQVDRLSADFNAQTAELETAGARARRAEDKLSRHYVDKASARQVRQALKLYTELTCHF